MRAELPQQLLVELVEVARGIATPGKGILAADESPSTMGKRLQRIGVENTEENRRAFRQILFSSPKWGQHISGVILHEETLFQKSTDGRSLVELIRAQDVIPGVKADLGLTELPGTDGEQATKGLDTLAERCQRYYEGGARFTKWRAVIKIDEASGKPSQQAVQETAHTLARYAAISQAQRLVPIVEPEVLPDGKHSIQVCAHVTETVLAAVFKALHDHGVLLEACVLKPNMATPGNESGATESAETIARFTLRTLYRTVPPALASINFLSGGQSEIDASHNLNAMNAGHRKHPWNISFSYGRALQASALDAWKKERANPAPCQAAFLERAKANSDAQQGEYKGQ